MGNSNQDSELELSGFLILQTAAVDVKEILKTSLSTESFQSQTGMCFLNAGIPAQHVHCELEGYGPYGQAILRIYICIQRI